MSTLQKRLTFVWMTLLGLLGTTVGVAYVLAGAPSVVTSLGIALAKATLIFWFFMQLRAEKGLIRAFAIGASVWLMILVILVTLDYGTR